MKIEEKHTKVDEERYKCVLWEQNGVNSGNYSLSLSEDASCNGLYSTEEGLLMEIYKGNTEGGVMSCKEISSR